MLTAEVRSRHLIPAYIRSENIILVGDAALIEKTPGGAQLLKRRVRADGYGYTWEYAGDVRQEGGEYAVALTAPYDPETDSDVTEVHRGQDFDAGVGTLWSLRSVV